MLDHRGTTITTSTTLTQKFLLADSGAYTINETAISTTADDIEFTVSSDTFIFNPNSSIITIAGKQFSGDGNVTVNGDSTFSLGDGAAVILQSAATETINNIPFRLSRNVGGNVTIANADNGFEILRTISGGVVNENFAIDGDADYSVSITASGIGTISGISSGATVKAGSSLSSGVDTVNNFNILTDGNSIYTFGNKSYTVAGDDSVLFNADFDNESATLKTVSSLDGTISGDFSTSAVTINGNDEVYILGDSYIDVVADSTNGITAVKNISDNATIVSAGKSSTLTATGAGTFTFGDDESALTFNTRTTSANFFLDENGSVFFSGDNSTISGSNNADSINNSGNNVLIGGLAGNDTITNSGRRVTIQGGDDADVITNSGSNVKIFGGANNDNIVNTADSVSIYGGEGDDIITNSGNLVTITGGEGANTITSSGSNVIINGSTSNEVINANLTDSTIDAGTGNDYISLSSSSNGNLIHYDNGDGNDTIVGLTADDTLKIATGNYATAISGNDVYVNIGSDRLLLIGAADSALSIDGLLVGEFTMTAGETKIINDITFTAAENSTLAANEDGSFTMSNGSVSAVVTGTNDPEITFDASDGAFTFSCAKNGTALEVTIHDDLSINYTSGKVTYYADKFTAERGSIGLLDKTGNVAVTLNVTNASGNTFNFADDENFAFTSNGGVNATINYSNTSISNITFNGEFVFNRAENTLNVNGNSSLTATIGNRTITLTATDDAGGELLVEEENLKITYTPNVEDGGLIMSVTENGTTRTTTLNCTGTVAYTLGGTIELSAATTITNSWSSGYGLSITTSRAASGTINLIDEGLQVTPNDTDAVVAQLTTPTGLIISNIKVDGTIIYDAATVTLKNGSKITATIDGNAVEYEAVNADAIIEFGANELTFTPGNGGSIAGANTYSGGSFKFGSDTDVIKLTPNIKMTTTVTSAQNFILESGGTYTINDRDYIISDSDGASLKYSNSEFEISELEGTLTMDLGSADTVGIDFYLSNGSERTAFGITASRFTAGVKAATIESDGYFAANKFENFDTYTLHSGRAGNYTLGNPAVVVNVDGDEDYNYLFDSSCKVTLTNISDGAAVTIKGETSDTTPYNIPIYNDAVGTYYVNGNTIEASGETAVTVNSDGSVSFNPSYIVYNGLKFEGDDAVTMPTGGAITLTENERIALAAGTYTINDIEFSIETADAAITIGGLIDGYEVIGSETEKLRVSGDADYKVAITADGIGTVSGISSNATVKGDGNYNIHTDGNSVYTFGDNTYTVTGDDNVAFEVSFSSETATVKSVAELDGVIIGDFRNTTTIDGTAVQIRGDNEVRVVASGDITTISGIGDGATIVSSGEAALITEGNVQLSNGYKVSSSGATLTSNDHFTIDNAAVTGTSDSDYINANGDKVSIYGSSGSDTLILSGDNGYISGGAGNDLITNVGANATIMTGSGNDTIINNGDNALIITEAASLQVSGDETYTVKSSNNTTLEGISGDATVTAASTYLNVVTDSEGAYVFGNSKVTILNDENVELNLYYNTSGDSVIRTISDLNGTIIFTSTTAQTVNGKTLTITPSGQQITVTADENGNIVALDGLEVGGTLSFGSTGSYTVNGTAIRITDINNQLIRNNDGYISVSYPTTTLESAWISDSTSNYVDTVEGYSDADSNNGNLVYYLNGDVNANFEETTGKKKVNISDGNIAVEFNDDGGNIASIQAETTGDKTLTLGNGGDIVIVEDTDSEVSIKAGSGADKISTHGQNVTIDLENSGATKIMASGGNVNLKNYDHSSGAGLQGINNKGDNDFTIGNGYIEMLGAHITFDDDNDSTIFNMYSSDADVTKIGFTYLNGGVVDLSDQTANVNLISKNGNSTLKGGSGNDTIESAGDDYIDAGGGNNTIKLNHTNYSNGATISAMDGHNTVSGLYGNTDKLLVSNILSAEFNYNDGDVIIKDGSARTLIESGSSGDEPGFVNLILLNSYGDSMRAAVTGTNGTITANADYTPNTYIGTRAEVNFGELTGDLNINLHNGRGTYNDDNLYFSGINNLAGGSGATTMISSNSNSTLTAGSGSTSMLGGTGNDVLIGNGGSTEYFFTSSGGKDTITNFNASDKINTFDAVVTGVRTLNNDVFVDFNNDSLRIIDAVDIDINFNDVVAKIGNSTLTYDNAATYYQANSSNATVKVADTVTSADVWLNDGGKYVGNIKTLDASGMTGTAILAGNNDDNVIMSGSGNASLWGGDFGNDTLIGGDANDMFWYLRGNGNDVITNAADGDVINLSGLTLANIATAEITSSGVNLNFTDGGSLNVRGANIGATFLLEGVRYKANQNSRTWTNA